MTDLPVDFLSPMIRALLDGRKTMMRHLIKDPGEFIGPQGTWNDPSCWGRECEDGRYAVLKPNPDNREDRQMPLRFAVGDRLWVREKIACGACAQPKPSYWSPSFWRREQGSPRNPNGLWYAADGLEPENQITGRGKWISSTQMPRWASRLTLTVTAVHVERLRDIREPDAIAEGCVLDWADDQPVWYVPGAHLPHRATGRESYRDLWSFLHGPNAWDANAWVTATSFTLDHRNIDALPTNPAMRSAA